MKLQYASFSDFKRFKNLQIKNIPDSARLVMIVGPNGCGKSSIFDGFLQWKLRSIIGISDDRFEYYLRGKENWLNRHSLINNQVQLGFHGDPPMGQDQIKSSFYFRTAYRFEGSFAMHNIVKAGPIIDENRFITMADSDTSVSKNYSRIVAQLINDLHSNDDDGITKGEWRDRRYRPLQLALNRLFPNLHLEGPGNPLEDGTFYFSKGDAKNFKYANLSSGEKAALDLLLDLHVRADAFKDSIYCLDEPEAHMNTNLHGELLQEIYNFIPENSQMWVATHSIGMIRRAMELRKSQPNQILFIDFHEIDLDKPQTLYPASVNPSFWTRNLRTTLADLSEIVAPQTIIFCEGASAESRSKKAEFDAQCYQRIFESEFPENVFISIGSSSEVLNRTTIFRGFLNKISRGSKISSLIDRDERTDEEIQDAVELGHIVLPLRHIEHYLLSDEILNKLCINTGRPEAYGLIASVKSYELSKLVESGYPADDIKRCKSQIYLAVKSALRGTHLRFGTNADIFCRDILAPLITPDTETYKSLRTAIFEQIEQSHRGS